MSFGCTKPMMPMHLKRSTYIFIEALDHCMKGTQTFRCAAFSTQDGRARYTPPKSQNTGLHHPDSWLQMSLVFGSLNANISWVSIHAVLESCLHALVQDCESRMANRGQNGTESTKSRADDKWWSDNPKAAGPGEEKQTTGCELWELFLTPVYEQVGCVWQGTCVHGWVLVWWKCDNSTKRHHIMVLAMRGCLCWCLKVAHKSNTLCQSAIW